MHGALDVVEPHVKQADADEENLQGRNIGSQGGHVNSGEQCSHFCVPPKGGWLAHHAPDHKSPGNDQHHGCNAAHNGQHVSLDAVEHCRGY